MKQYTTSFSFKKNYIENVSYVFLDIETTGLKKETALLYLISCGFWDGEQLTIHQWFNDDAISEEEMLLTLCSFFKEHAGTLVTFNGENFDLPFLQAHLTYHEMNPDIFSDRISLDLYKMLRGFAAVYRLKNSTQKAWEHFLGIDREDCYDGGKLIPVYKHYLKTKDADFLEKLLLHNVEDVKGLALLLPLLTLQQMYSNDFEVMGLSECFWNNRPAITFQLQYPASFPKELSVETAEGAVCIPSTGNELKVTIPFVEGKLYHFYPDYHNYYYLPAEDRAVHKKIGCYVDKEHRKNASAKDCYSPLESIFFKIPEKTSGYGFCVNAERDIVLPYFRANYEAREKYVSYDHLFENDTITENTKQYLCHVIQSILLGWIRR